MQIEHRISVTARPEYIFQIYKDVGSWHTWDPDTKSASLNGAFVVGNHGKLTPAKGNTVPMVVTGVTPNRSFTVETNIPWFRMVFEHELIPHGAMTEVVHRVTMSGFLAVLLRPILGKQINAGMPRALTNLRQLAEARSAA